MQEAISTYLDEVERQLNSGQAIENAYRPALKHLMESVEDTIAVNDPKHSEHGAPDFVFLKETNSNIIKGYAEAKDVTVSLDKTEKTNQMERYAGYSNLFLTDYLEFRFFKNGEKYETISLGRVSGGKLQRSPENNARLGRELQAFLELPPEKIRSGKRLSQIMGGKARRLRDYVAAYLHEENGDNSELLKIYEMMKELLVHDLDTSKFADMYSQTLVYGLFVARYGDETPDSFTRNEARDLVPKSNPFLRHFFDHIIGPNFDKRLGVIVDELCEVFSVSDVRNIVHKHLRIQDLTDDSKDPIIHFYEDFLEAYDPAERKRMGAYYTPIPVVKFIVRHVDKLLKQEFGIVNGLSSAETITQEVETQPWRKKYGKIDRTTKTVIAPRVQVLDPAVGTATFLNEVIKYIYQGFEGQEGRWPAYVQDSLVKRLYGFELMMAPYTIAHLKLGMTLKETGVTKLDDRLEVYLTNTLEEGVPHQPHLFNFGLAEAVSEESRLAAEVKSERPVMVVMGNPPYSVSSNNKSDYIQALIQDYKKDLNERKINLDDDYIKFIRFAENMVEKNGEGIVSMITNNSYLEGATHRQMRKHLLKTFNKIYILDLHGSSKKQELDPAGGKDQNVFDIQQGVSIILAVKTDTSNEAASVYHAELYGQRKTKFSMLSTDELDFKLLDPVDPAYFFVPKDLQKQEEYLQMTALQELMPAHVSGVESVRDAIAIQFTQNEIRRVVQDFLEKTESEIANEYKTQDARDWKISRAKIDVKKNINNPKVWQSISYRPFDTRHTFYSGAQNGFVCNGRYNVMKHMTEDNIALLATSKNRQLSEGYIFLSEHISDRHALDSAADSMSVFPLWLYFDDHTRSANIDRAKLKVLLSNVGTYYYDDGAQTLAAPSGSFVMITPEDILDYIYATFHSPFYRENFKELLKREFPRIPQPANINEFNRLVVLGNKLRQLHLMKQAAIDTYDSTFPAQGDNLVEKVTYKDSRVNINASQYFGNVSELAWNFYVGGYQPAQKWLKDRKGRKLSNNDLDHYQRIIQVLTETHSIMQQIDIAGD